MSISSGCLGLQGRSLISWHLTLGGLRQKDIASWGARAKESGCCGFISLHISLHLAGPFAGYENWFALERQSFPTQKVFFFLRSQNTIMYKKLNMDFTSGSAGKESACNAGDLGLIPGLGRSSGEGKGNPLQYSGLENSVGCIVSPWGYKELDVTE